MNIAVHPTISDNITTFDLYVRGEIPAALRGSLVVACSRRNKDRGLFARWHDSQADLLRLDLSPGKPGRVRASILAVDPSGARLECGDSRTAFDRHAYGRLPDYGYATQPNHGINIAGGTVWATNLLFGAPLEVDLATLRPRRLLRYVEPDEVAPRMSGTSHFAWSLDGRYAYFHQSLLVSDPNRGPVQARDLRMVELDVRTGAAHVWDLLPPPDDDALEEANFHSAFYFEESGKRYVGLLRTGALIESLAPHSALPLAPRHPARPSTIWIVEIDRGRDALHAELLPEIRESGGLALSHLDVDASGGDGFVLYANFKQAEVGAESHGANIYGEQPSEVTEHYAGMVVEALNYGLVIRYERRRGRTTMQSFSRHYDPGQSSLGHTWLPINIELSPTRRYLFCTFSGFRPRLLSAYMAAAHPDLAVDAEGIGYVPPALIRFDATTLQPDYDQRRSYISYAEPIALAVTGNGIEDYVCTFSPEIGLRIYRAEDLNAVICHAGSASLMHWEDSHFRPEPAHMQFVPA